MEGIVKLLEGFEDLAYRILMLVIIIPKTLLKIIFEPTWAPGYINEQLGIIEKNKSVDEKAKSPTFVEYLSPVLLLLVLALVPALLLNFLPKTGITITLSTGQESVPEGSIRSLVYRNLSATQDAFIAEASFSSSARRKGNRFEWRVEKQNPEDGKYSIVPGSKEIHRDSEVGNTSILYKDDNTVQDTFIYDFKEQGKYHVVVEVRNFAGLTFSDFIYVEVAPTETKELKAYIDDSRLNTGSTKEEFKRSLTIENLSSLLQKETTIFLAIGLMLPPLFFAYVYGMITRKNINEQLMREIFYKECYYFAPLSLAIWAFYYSLFFLTEGTFELTFKNSELITIPPVLALVWFISVETNALADDSKEDNIDRPKAFLIVISCIIVMLVLSLLIYLSATDVRIRDIVRDNIIWLYLCISLGLMAVYVMNWRKARKRLDGEIKEEEKDKKIRKLNFRKLIIPLSVFTLVLCCIIPTVWLFWPVAPESTALSPSDGTGTVAPPTEESSDNTPLSQDPYYTEEFEGNMDNWELIFVVNGDESQVNLSTENSSLHVQLFEQADQFPSAYVINNANRYTNVQVEAIAKSNNENSNTVSLICRYNDNGWYEFEISNSGYYNIYAAEQNNENISYTTLTSGNSAAVKTDLSENTYTAICKGNELTLIINSTPVETIRDTTSNFTEGQIGVAIYSPEGLETDVAIESVTISEPSSQEDTADVEATMINVEATALPVAEATPSEIPVVSEDPLYFTEEFDGDLNAWLPFMAFGEESQVNMNVEDGNLVLHLSPVDGTIPTQYLFNADVPYTDVQLDVVTTNIGNNANAVILVCRFTDNGWYEFDISNSGVYEIYAVDANGAYNKLSSGVSPNIKSGYSTNLYSGVCKGSELSLYVNGELVETVSDAMYNFNEGNIGIGVSAFQVLPIDVAIDSVTVSKPE